LSTRDASLGEVPASSPKGEGRRGSKRTLTNLYNARPTWLDLAHKRLDEAVFAAYGWKSDLADEEILEKLLALNLGRGENKKCSVQGEGGTLNRAMQFSHKCLYLASE